MYPTLSVNGVDFGEDVVFGVPYPADSRSHGPAEHAEAVGPFANTTAAGLEQHKGVVVSRITFVLAALLE